MSMLHNSSKCSSPQIIIGYIRSKHTLQLMAMPSTTIHFRPVEQAFILYIDLKNGIRVDGKGLCSVLKERNEHPREFNTALKFFRRALQVMREMDA
jgi:hypothetical protein